MGIAYAVVDRFGIVGGTLKDEAVSVALVALCEAADTYDGERAKFSTWAWLRVHWALVRWVRAQRRQRALRAATDGAEPDDLPSDGPGTDEQSADAEFRAMVARALEGIPRLQRRMLTRVAALMVAGHTNVEIAAQLGVCRNTVGTLKAKLREQLEVTVGHVRSKKR